MAYTRFRAGKFESSPAKKITSTGGSSRQADRDSRRGIYDDETLSMRQRRINEVKHKVSEAWAGRYDIQKARLGPLPAYTMPALE